jgi:cytochrome c oxidase cbb3-type subunit II
MPYRSLAALLIVKDQGGTLWHHYQGAGSSGRHRGPYIEWLNDEQRAHFLRMGLVEEIDGPEAVVDSRRPEASPENGALPELVAECIQKLDQAEVPSDAGAPTCRTALREKGISFSNQTIAQAVRQRKMRAS